MTFAVGDKVMLMGVGARQNGCPLQLDRIKAIHKNGTVVLEESDRKYRLNGTAIGKAEVWGSSFRMLAWDEGLWQKNQAQEVQRIAANRICDLGDALMRLARNDRARAAEI